MNIKSRRTRLISAALSTFVIFGLSTTTGRAQPACDAVVYWDAGFKGESWEVRGNQDYVGPHWNDRISSIRIVSGRWEFYWDAGYKGEVLRLGPGDYPYIGDHWNDQISSIRCVGGGAIDAGGGAGDAYVADGQRYDWYEDGWNGAGFYVVGFAFRNGRGFGGREGFHGWHHRDGGRTHAGPIGPGGGARIARGGHGAGGHLIRPVPVGQGGRPAFHAGGGFHAATGPRGGARVARGGGGGFQRGAHVVRPSGGPRVVHASGGGGGRGRKR